MKDDLLYLEAASPEELGAALSMLSEKSPAKNRFVDLNISGPQVLVRQFDLPRLNSRELKYALELEVAEILPEGAELDYQVISCSKDKLNGIFVAAPKKLLGEYIACCERLKFIPVKITAEIISAINSFFYKNKIKSGNFCLLVFSPKKRIYLAVFDNNICMLLREIVYENLSEAKQEVMDSLKYSCSKSACKHMDDIYCSGDLAGKDELISWIEKEFNVNIQRGEFVEPNLHVPISRSLFKINLIKKHSVSLFFRNSIIMAENIVMALCIAVFLNLGIEMFRDHLQISKLRDSFKNSDYDYYLSLLEKVRLFNNAK